jgi:hypothetical protein
MASTPPRNPVADLLAESVAAPLGEVIAAVGQGVAEAQRALDDAALAATMAIYEEQGDAGMALLRDIGYRPTFYVLPDTQCQVQVSMRIGGTGSADGSAGTARLPGALGKGRTYVTPVDAGFQQRFGFQATAAAKLTFRIVPVPPPSALDDARPMPALVGEPAPDALAALDRLGLTGRLVDKAGAAVTDAKGRKVTAQAIAAGRLAAQSEPVELTVE